MGQTGWSALVAAGASFAMLGVLVVLLRWAFSTRRRTATLESPSPNVDKPGLRVIQSLDSEREGLAKCLLLTSHGIEAEIVRLDRRLHLAVHVTQVRAAQTILGLPQGPV